jgi:hypothetical protein
MAGEDDEYRAWLETLPCCMCLVVGQSTVHHRTGAGGALRDHDHNGMPMCHRCHMDLHDLRGRFSGWTKRWLRDWQDAQIARHRAAYARHKELREQRRAMQSIAGVIRAWAQSGASPEGLAARTLNAIATVLRASGHI